MPSTMTIISANIEGLSSPKQDLIAKLCSEMTVDGKDIEVVTKFVFLAALITKDGLCEKEVRRRIAMGKAAMGGLTSTWKDRGVTMETKVKLVTVLVLPIVLYGAETWTMRKHERRKIDAFELWCWRRVLRVSWMEIKTDIWIIENTKPEWTLESGVPKAALSYFGHVVRAGGMEDDVMLGRMNGTRRRRTPRKDGWTQSWGTRAEPPSAP